MAKTKKDYRNIKKEGNSYSGELWINNIFTQKVLLTEFEYRYILLIDKFKNLSDEELTELSKLMELKFQEGFDAAHLYYS